MSTSAESEFPLLAHMGALVEELRTSVPKALHEWDEEAIHDGRVATRRLKAALDLLKWVVSKNQRNPFARILRKLRRQLGPLRDLDMMLGHLAEFETNSTDEPAVLWLKEHLRQRRDDVRS